MTMYWGSDILPDPHAWTVTDEYVGSQQVMADGTLAYDGIADYKRITITWRGITGSQRTQIRAKAIGSALETIQFLDGTVNEIHYSVAPMRNTYRENPIGYAPVYDVECTVRGTGPTGP